eukprot:CAMPEP_0116902182 /NCGR_PEP_ID=MMETSP0467-20121206/9853_1 /TAXON_ID=283647 /ORGANISM="Mesodinium pulex, Strain SPMC105" /LENGTH=63 /DNA_ID=CAMNT_0004575951 /DNA_START=406 /DNA_END=597 /DNA_ORIENTATION=+
MSLAEFADNEIQQVESKQREQAIEQEGMQILEKQRQGFTTEQYMEDKEEVEDKDRKEKIDWDA